jgi:excisionase family DNA binding protein
MKNLEVTFESMPQVLAQLVNEIESLRNKVEALQQPKVDQDEMLTIQEAGELLNLTVPTMYSKVSKREIPFIKPKGNKRLYFSRIELIEYLKQGRGLTNTEIEAQAENFLNKKGGAR